jgi:hypothetical protein
VKKLFLRIRREQDDHPNAAFLSQHMCLSSSTQRDPATDRQDELAVARVVGKLTHLGWIGLREHAHSLHCR